MPKQITEDPKAELRRVIERSVLLSEDQREALLRVLPTLSGEQVERLRQLLEQETGTIERIVQRSITVAVSQGNAAFLRDLDVFLQQSTRGLRKAEEHAERADEQDKISHSFDPV